MYRITGHYPRERWRVETAGRLSAAAGEMPLGHAVDGYLATLRGARHENTSCVYGRILRRVIGKFSSGTH